MSALPGQRMKSYVNSLERVTALHPEHISAYSLIIEEGTLFYERYGEADARRRAEGADRRHLLPGGLSGIWSWGSLSDGKLPFCEAG